MRSPPGVALLTAEGRAYERRHELSRQLVAHYPAAYAEDVHVVVLHALSGRVGVVAHAGAYPADLVRGDARPHPTAANNHSAVRLLARHATGNGSREVGIVVRRIDLVGSNVYHDVSHRLQVLDEGLLQGESGVVRSDGDSHTAPG